MKVQSLYSVVLVHYEDWKNIRKTNQGRDTLHTRTYNLDEPTGYIHFVYFQTDVLVWNAYSYHELKHKLHAPRVSVLFAYKCFSRTQTSSSHIDVTHVVHSWGIHFKFQSLFFACQCA